MWYALSGLNPNDDVVMYATSEKANTAVGQDELPVLVSSLAVYPNPASSQVKVGFSLSRPGILAMEVRDLLGREVRSINLGHRAAGEHIVLWSGLDVGNAPVPAGAYIVSILNRETGLRSSGGIVQVVH
jgi:flagellar hook assembly protein FlgD